MEPCPAPSKLSDLVSGVLSPQDASPLQVHVESCTSCKQHLHKLQGVRDTGTVTGELPSTESPQPEGPPLPRGTALGRYLVLDRVGAGGMGVVFSAYDPELDRRVAVKLLQAGSGARSPDGLRLLREAQALAQLSHPNVIAVYDVGTVGDRVFMAMELVEGQSLRSWLQERARGWQEVLALFSEVAAGVAAAHARGLVHRDLKPDNILVGKDGRARVLDFGLARLSTAPAETPRPPEVLDPTSSSGSGSALRQNITRLGAVVGTPSYIPPEAVKGAAPDAQADQFSFSVALYEALYGERPFPAVGFLDPNRWHLREPPRASRVPAWLRKVVLRGLSLDPAQRFPSMQALGAALASNPSQRRRRLWLGGAAAAALAGLAFTVLRAPGAPRMCQGSSARLTGVWDPAVSGKLSAAFLATGNPIATESFARVREAVEAYTRQWVRMHTDACEATRVRGEQSDEVLSLRMSCLDQRLKEVKALTEVLLESTATVMAQAPRAALALTPLDGCANVEALRAPVAPPTTAEGRAKVDALSARLPRVKALLDSARYAEGLTAAEPLAREASLVAYRPLEAETLELFGLLQEKAGKRPEAVESFKRALNAAVAGGHRRLSAWSAARLTRTYMLLQQPEQAVAWGAYAKGALEVLGGDPLIEAYVEMALGSVNLLAGNSSLADTRFQRALSLRTQALGAAHPDVAASLNNLGASAGKLGRPKESIEFFSRAADVWTRALGPDHPETLQARMNLAVSLLDIGQVERAKAENDRAREGVERTLGPEHPLLGVLWSQTAKIASAQRDGALALKANERTVLIKEQTLGKDHPTLAEDLRWLALTQEQQGLSTQALATLERALRIPQPPKDGPEQHCLLLRTYAAVLRALGRVRDGERALGRCVALAEAAQKEHPFVLADALVALADADVRSGDLARAWPSLRRALALVEAQGPKSSDALEVFNAVARAYTREGRRKEALALLERAVGLEPVTAYPNHGKLGDSQFLLAKLLAQQQGDPARIRALVQRAILAYDSTTNPGLADDAKRWLANYDAKTR